MSLVSGVRNLSLEQASLAQSDGSVKKDPDESKREIPSEKGKIDSQFVQEILWKECQNEKNIDRSPPQIVTISGDAETKLKQHGPDLKSLNLYVLVPYDPKYYPEDMVELRWDSTLLSKVIYPHLKAIETLKLPDCRDSIYSLGMLPSLCHLQLDSELLDRGSKGIKASVTYTVDSTNKELNQHLYQLLFKLFGQEARGVGPNLKSLKVTYRRETVNHCLPALETLQKKLGGFVVKSGERSALDISINSPAVPVDALVLTPPGQ
jgi:hypothetical protein